MLNEQRKPRTETQDSRERQPEPMASERLNIDADGIRKTYFLDLEQNGRGRVVKLKERRNSGSSLVLIPADSAREIAELLTRLAEYHEQNPA